MKILAINSSHSGEKGYTGFLIDKLFQGAREVGADCEAIILVNLRITPCLGCLTCQTEKHHLRCVFDEKDDVRFIFDKIRGADILIFATPVYVFGMSSRLKALLERFHSTADVDDFRVSGSGMFFHAIDRDLCSKPFVTVVCCDNLEDETPKNVLSYFGTYSKFMDAPCVGLMVRNAGELTGHGKDPGKENTSPRIFQIYDAYVQAGKELATMGRISKITQQKANQEVISVPFFKYIKRIKPLKPILVEKARKMAGKEGRFDV